MQLKIGSEMPSYRFGPRLYHMMAGFCSIMNNKALQLGSEVTTQEIYSLVQLKNVLEC